MSLIIVPIELSEANALVKRWHRHHKEAQGHRFSIGAYDTKKQELVGAVIVGRPVARLVNWRTTVEVVRLVSDGTKNACSILYAASARVAKELGYEKIQTYILDTEAGTSLLASGWECESKSAGGGHGWHSRSGRRDDQPENTKQRWSKALNPPVSRQVVAKPNNRSHLDVGDSPAQKALFTPEADTAEGKLPAPAPRR
jgi:hypothetical protein